jgi:hypothetical protein
MTLKYANSGVLPSGASRFEPPTSDSAKEHFLDQSQELGDGSGINNVYPSPESYSIEKSGVFRSYQLQTPTDGNPPQPSGDPDGQLTSFTNNVESISNKERSIFASSGLQSEFSNGSESKKEADEINDFTIFNTYKHYYSVIGEHRKNPDENKRLRFVDTPRKKGEQNNDTLRPLEIEYLSTAVRSRFTFKRYPFD